MHTLQSNKNRPKTKKKSKREKLQPRNSPHKKGYIAGEKKRREHKEQTTKSLGASEQGKKPTSEDKRVKIARKANK